MFVSAWYFLTKYLPVLAYTLQSSVLRSSPGLYLRCSENSTENPWYGLECSPDRKPCTMNFARRSSRATWRITSGRRYFSAVIGIILPTPGGWVDPARRDDVSARRGLAVSRV